MVKSLINYKVQSLLSLVLGVSSKGSTYDLCLLNRNLFLCGIIIQIKSTSLYILYRKKQEERDEPLLSQHACDLSGIAFFPWGKVGQLKHAVGDVRCL